MLPIHLRLIDMMGILALLKSQAAHFRTISKDGDEESLANNSDYTISLRIPRWHERAVENIYPHWNDYMEALRLCNPDNQTWLFDKMELPTEMLNALKSLMITRNIHRLEFNNSNDISELRNPEAIFDLFLGILEKNSTVKCVIIRHSFTLGMELYKALANHPTLEEVHMWVDALGRDALV